MMVGNARFVVEVILGADVVDDARPAHKVLELGKKEVLAYPLTGELRVLQTLLMRDPFWPAKPARTLI